MSKLFLYILQYKRGSQLIFEAALYSSLYGIYICERAQHLPDMLISVGIYTETCNLNVVIAVT